MRIHFYEVKNCTFEMIQGVPAIIAPEGVDDETLQRHYFIRMYDGRWFHYLTYEEYNYMMSFSGSDEVIYSFDRPVVNYGKENNKSPEDEKKANMLCGISLGSIALSLLMGTLEMPELIMPCWIASLVLMIIVRVKYPENTFGKVLMILYIILGILMLIGSVLFLIACNAALEEFLDSCSGLS